MSTLPWLWILLLLVSGPALGNTEIVNFSASKRSFVNLPFTEKWPILRPSSPTIQVNVTSAPLGSILPQTMCPRLDKWHPQRLHICPHELWLVLDLDADEWKDFNKFTLRLSWPAFHPTDFFMEIFDPQSLQAFADKDITPAPAETRRKYARIQLIHTGVLTPGANKQLDEISRHTVPIHLIVEPLLFGVLPSSVLPVVFAIIATIAVGLPIATKINAYFQGIVDQVKAQKGRKSKIS